MPENEAHNAEDRELALLRLEASERGMPGMITPESVGVTLESPESILARLNTSGSDLDDLPAPSQLRQKTRRRLPLVATVAAAAAVAVAVVVVVAPSQQHSAVALTPPVLDYEFAAAQNIAFAPGEDAQGTLRDLAQAAERQDASPGSGSTQYVLTDNWFATLDATEAAKLIPKRRETWFRSDGTTWVRETAGQALAPDGRGLSRDEDANPRVGPVDETYPAEDGLDPAFVSKLHGDYRAVRKALLESGQCEAEVASPPRAQCIYQEIATLYSQYVIPPKLAAALWRMLSEEPSLRSLGSVKDRAGRSGIGISLIPADSPQFRKILVISPTTGRLLGTEEILIKNDPDVGIKAPAIYAFTAILEARYVDDRGPAATQ